MFRVLLFCLSFFLLLGSLKHSYAQTTPDGYSLLQGSGDNNESCVFLSGRITCFRTDGYNSSPIIRFEIVVPPSWGPVKRVAEVSNVLFGDRYMGPEECVLADEIHCWGSAYYLSRLTMVQNLKLTKPRDMELGYGFACILDGDLLHCWGNRDSKNDRGWIDTHFVQFQATLPEASLLRVYGDDVCVVTAGRIGIRCFDFSKDLAPDDSMSFVTKLTFDKIKDYRFTYDGSLCVLTETQLRCWSKPTDPKTERPDPDKPYVEINLPSNLVRGPLLVITTDTGYYVCTGVNIENCAELQNPSKVLELTGAWGEERYTLFKWLKNALSPFYADPDCVFALDGFRCGTEKSVPFIYPLQGLDLIFEAIGTDAYPAKKSFLQNIAMILRLSSPQIISLFTQLSPELLHQRLFTLYALNTFITETSSQVFQTRVAPSFQNTLSYYQSHFPQTKLSDFQHDPIAIKTSLLLIKTANDSLIPYLAQIPDRKFFEGLYFDFQSRELFRLLH